VPVGFELKGALAFAKKRQMVPLHWGALEEYLIAAFHAGFRD
jgi:hypothetical protein